VVPGAGIEPAQPLRPRDFKCENRIPEKACVIKAFLISQVFFFIRLVGKCWVILG
jgi:hypothetical protein